MFAMKTEGLDVIDRRTYPDGLVIEIHHATLNLRTEWFVVVWPRGGSPVRTVGTYDSLQAACDARDGYSGPR
jgi:hypothetical protein